MIELVLVVFLVSVAVMATVAVKVGMKAVDFVDATYKFYNRIEEGQKEIIRLLGNREWGAGNGDPLSHKMDSGEKKRISIQQGGGAGE